MKHLLAVLCLTASPALAQMNHAMPPTASTTKGNPMTGLQQLSGQAFDRAYLSMMVAHHQGALDMARAVQGRVKDPQVRGWVANIIRDQSREIQDMQAWLKPLGGLDRAVADHMTGEMHAMLTPLQTAPDPDRAFVQGMLPHHASALDMAALALLHSRDPRVWRLSRDIITAQASEMDAFQRWLAGPR